MSARILAAKALVTGLASGGARMRLPLPALGERTLRKCKPSQACNKAGLRLIIPAKSSTAQQCSKAGCTVCSGP